MRAISMESRTSITPENGCVEKLRNAHEPMPASAPTKYWHMQSLLRLSALPVANEATKRISRIHCLPQ